MQLLKAGPILCIHTRSPNDLTKVTGLHPVLNTEPGWAFCDRHCSVTSLPGLTVFGGSVTITVGRHIVRIAKPYSLVIRPTGRLVTVRPSSTLRTT